MASASFTADKTRAATPFYVTFTDTTDTETSAADYLRIWEVTSVSGTYDTTYSYVPTFNYAFLSGNDGFVYTVTLTVSGVDDVGFSNSTFSIDLSSCGPSEPLRLDPNKTIDIVQLLPNYLKESETNDVVSLIFQNFLNTIYDEYLLTTSASDYELDNIPKISVLEKINRLTELHDPALVDIEYIQFFANYLGYDINVNRGELGVIQDQNPDDPAVQEDVKRYLRFIVSNLPTWYKIKTTNDCVKIMLFSFGLIGDIISRWTNDYREDIGPNWISFVDGTDSLSDIPSDFYPTPHFLVSINLDTSESTFLNPNTRNAVFNAIKSIKPVNDVFDGFLGLTRSQPTVYVKASVRNKLYLHIT